MPAPDLQAMYTAPDPFSNSTYQSAKALMDMYNATGDPRIAVLGVVGIPAGQNQAEVLSWNLLKSYGFADTKLYYLALQRTPRSAYQDSESFTHLEVVGLSLKLAASNSDPLQKFVSLVQAIRPDIDESEAKAILFNQPAVLTAAADFVLAGLKY